MTATRPRKLILFVNALVTGHHEAAWRLPSAEPERLRDLRYYQSLARTAEEGGFDAMFVADFFVFYPGVAHSPRWELDPLTLLAGVAQATRHLGLIATASATFGEAGELARSFATLDQLSRGRAAWNIVTNGEPQAAANYGQDTPIPHGERYARGDVVVRSVLAHWRNAHAGNGMPPPVQPRPVLVQAGSSEQGRDFAARHADVVFTAQPTLAAGQAFRADLRQRAQAHGRSPDSIKVIPGISPSLAHTDGAAAARKQRLDALISPEASLGWLAGFGIDLSGHSLDGPLPAFLGDLSAFEGIKSRYGVITELIKQHRPASIRALLHLLAGSRGHASFTGTPRALAAYMTQWFDAGAADGFMLMPHAFPDDLAFFVEEVSPLLRRAGLIPAQQSQPGTLRERLGLPACALPSHFHTKETT
ncbi:LLM class flavin-dependent oxidoreductase [Orrella dioscoreae]|uniref:Nitrilotriacetate monooxygenase component A n=2 Tax=root TaxID=1 RepID=A0A1C3K0Q4_9BURK|nr:LLM class flavin-dependent oxidoreductase [Orrella dioscoreae]SBT25092.1 Nitrilotriacetate monooxygenase component A [Orrella dioscoreae]SOE50830.1 Nitrilotriacetate monooxygenase component A [Orrella dioscoreae]